MEGVSRMPMTEEGKVDGWYAYNLFAFGIVYSHNCIPISFHPFSFFIHKIILQKAVDGWGAGNSEGGDYDVSWMVGVEGLANEVRIYVAFVVTFINKISLIYSLISHNFFLFINFVQGGNDELGIIHRGGGNRGVICGLALGVEGITVGGARARNCGNGGGGEGGDYGSLLVRIHKSPFATAFIFVYYYILIFNI